MPLKIHAPWQKLSRERAGLVVKYRMFGKTIDNVKSFKNLYIQLLDKNFIANCIWKASKGKQKRRDVKRVLNNIPHYVEIIYDTLIHDTFTQPKHHVREIVERGKARTIVKPKFIESVIHYMIMEILKPIFMARFGPGICASIPGRGSSYGKKRIIKYIRKLQRKHYHFPRIYVFKMDVSKYFRSIDRVILMTKLKRLIHDKRMLNLLWEVIDCKDVPGLPLGFLTSQWLANFYLLEFDRYVTDNLRQPTFLRYMDDVVVFSESKERLHHLANIAKVYLDCSLNLKIKPNWQVFQLTDDLCGKITGRPLDFMGFKFYYNRVTLRKSILRSVRRTILRTHKKQKTTIYDSRCIISRLGWLKQASTYKFYKVHLSTYVNPKSHRLYISNYDGRHAT